MKLTGKKLTIGGAIIVIILIVLLASRMKKGETEGLTSVLDLGAEGFPVEIEVLTTGELELFLTLSGAVTAQRDVILRAKNGGETTAVPAELGDAVKKGDVIATLDSESAQLTLNQAEAALQGAAASYEPAKKSLERFTKLFAEGDVSEKLLDEVIMSERNLKAQLISAQAARDLAVKNLADTKITAPFSGYIAEIFIETGDVLGVGSNAARLVDIDTLEIKTGFTQKEMQYVQAGLELEVYLPEDENKIWKGYIRAIGPAAGNDGNFPAEIIIPNPELTLKPGMVTEAKIVYERLTDIVSIPRVAVLKEAGEEHVFIASGGIAVKRRIRYSKGDIERVAVVAGVSAGDSLIINGHTILKDGVGVRIFN